MSESISNNLFLIIANLAQVSNKELLISLFTSSLNNIFNTKSIVWVETIEKQSTYLPLVCNESNFGYIVFDLELDKNEFGLLSNAVLMVSVFLDKINQNELLNNKEKLLSKLVDDRTKQLQKEKEFTTSIINALTDTFYLFDPVTGKALQWNNSLLEITGYTDAEIAKMKTPDDFYSKKDIENALVKLSEIKETGKATLELNLICKNGKRVPTEYQVSTVDFDTDNSNYFISIGRDVTERKLAEKQLKVSQERLSLSLEASRASIFENKLTNNKIIFSNELFKCLGYEESDIPNTEKSFGSLINPDDIGLIDEALKHYLKGLAPYFYCEFRILNKQKDWVWCSSHGKTVKYDKEGKPKVIVGVIKDINFQKVAELAIMDHNDEMARQNEEYQVLNEELETSLKQIQHININLEKAREKAEESDRLKSAFLANMSHEIRTPMNSILGFSSFLTDDDVDHESRKKYASLVENSGIYLLRLIDDIIDISKIESNQLVVNKEEVDIGSILLNVESVIKHEKGKRKKEHIRIQLINRVDIEGIACNTDKTRLTQIFINLLTNALKYTEKGEIIYGVDNMDSEKIEFFVKDTGRGIDNKNLKIIFERFRQIETEIYREGTGLGLSITKGLVRLLGGELRVDSKLNVGSTFYFSIETK